MTLPVSAIRAGSVKLAAEGRSAITTPTKPIRTAVQRRQPTRSPSSSTESAVTRNRARQIECRASASGMYGHRPEEHRDFEQSRARCAEAASRAAAHS